MCVDFGNSTNQSPILLPSDHIICRLCPAGSTGLILTPAYSSLSNTSFIFWICKIPAYIGYGTGYISIYSYHHPNLWSCSDKQPVSMCLSRSVCLMFYLKYYRKKYRGCGSGSGSLHTQLYTWPDLIRYGPVNMLRSY